MEKTAKEHFKAMYQAVRMERLPCEIAVAAIDAGEDFGRAFAVDVAIAARRAVTHNTRSTLVLARIAATHNTLAGRLRRYKRLKANSMFDSGLPF